jgi:hypothetical protein
MVEILVVAGSAVLGLGVMVLVARRLGATCPP